MAPVRPATKQPEEERASRPAGGQRAEAGGRRPEQPLVAVAPDASLPEEAPSAGADASAGAAWRGLEELLSMGKINATKAAKLKSGFRLLQKTLKRTQESEIRLLAEAKRCRATLQSLQSQVEGAEEQVAQAEPNTEVGRLRQQLLQAYNDFKVAEDRKSTMGFQIECLSQEKRCLEKEYKAQFKPLETESREKSLSEQCEELRREVEHGHLEVRRLTEALETHKMQQKALEVNNEIIEKKQAELAKLQIVPEKLLRQFDRFSLRKAEAEKKAAALDKEISERREQLSKAGRRNRALEEEITAERKEERRRRAEVEASEREHRALLKEHESTKEAHLALAGERGLLETRLTDAETDGKLANERCVAQIRMKDRQMKALKRMEHLLKLANGHLEHDLPLYNNIKTELECQRDAADSSLQRMTKFQNEVEALKVDLGEQLQLAEKEELEVQQEEVRRLQRESDSLREELRNLGRLMQIKADERGQKHRLLLKAEQMKQHIEQELRGKDFTIMDLKKQYAVLQLRISKYSKMYDIICEERDKYVGLKHKATERINDMATKIYNPDKDVEILHTAAIRKDRELARARLKHSYSSKISLALRNEISKASWRLLEMDHQFGENELELAKLSDFINSSEQTLLDVTKQLNTASQTCSDLTYQLVECEQEVSSLQEKQEWQLSALARGNVALDALEEEVKSLQAAVAEERRQVELKKQQLSDRRNLEGEVAVLQIQLSEAQDQSLVLETLENDLSHNNIFRELDGTDPTPQELLGKIEQLESRIANCYRQLMEKQLLLDQVTRLSAKIKEEEGKGHLDCLTQAKEMNKLHVRNCKADRRLKSISAELSLHQAEVVRLQREIGEKELQVETCQRRLEQGLPPCPEMEEEWRRALREERRRQRDKQEKERLAEEQEWSQLPNGVHTTAEARPVAYIPQDDPLPLPKPYGALAPFKPSEPGANIRHIRKPKAKPTEV